MKKNINLEMGAQNMDKHITTPITAEVTKNLKSGDYVYITGTIYVARDAAHKRMIEALERGENLPIDIKDSTIYYMGPSPASGIISLSTYGSRSPQPTWLNEQLIFTFP